MFADTLDDFAGPDVGTGADFGGVEEEESATGRVPAVEAVLCCFSGCGRGRFIDGAVGHGFEGFRLVDHTGQGVRKLGTLNPV